MPVWPIGLLLAAAVAVPALDAAQSRVQRPESAQSPSSSSSAAGAAAGSTRPAPDTAAVRARFDQGIALFQQAVDLIEKARTSQAVIDSPEWKGLNQRLDRAVGMFEYLQECLCPASGAQSGLVHWWAIRNDRRYSDNQRADALQSITASLAETTTCLATARQQAPTLAPLVAQIESTQRAAQQGQARGSDRPWWDKTLFPDAGAQEAGKRLQGNLTYNEPNPGTSKGPEPNPKTYVPIQGTGQVVVTDPNGQEVKIPIEVATNEIPDEPGCDEWAEWYRRWMQMIAENVYRPVEREFANTGGVRMSVDIRYAIDRSGKYLEHLSTGGTIYPQSQVQTGIKYRTSILTKLTALHPPPLPSCTKLPKLTRMVTFSHNMIEPGIYPKGPPKG